VQRDGARWTTPVFAHPGWRTLLILCVYGYQGLVAGFAFNAVPNLHAGLGTPATAIGAFIAAVGLPWTFQPLWGPVVDRFGGSTMGARRSWLLLGMCGAIACLAAVPLAAESLPRLAAILFLHSACAALVDTALDGLMIDRLPTDRLGHATALTRVGFAVGTALGATLFASLLPGWGVAGASVLLLVLVCAAATVPLFVREEPGDALISLRRRPAAPPEDAWRALWAGLRTLRRPDALLLLGFCFVEEFTVGAFGLLLSVPMVQRGGWDPADLSRLQGMMALLGGTVGALLIGWWSDRVGARRALLALLLVCVAAHLAAAVLLMPGDLSGWAAGLALVLSGVAPALFFVALAPAVMLGSRGTAAATRFALFMSALNLGGVSGAAISGHLGDLLAPAGAASAAAVVFACLAAIAWQPALLFGRADASAR